MDRFAQLTLGITAAVFALVACLGWFAPDILMAPAGIEMTEAAGYAEIRAAYGGLFSASALVYALGTARASMRPHAIRLMAVVLGGFVLGRLISLVVEGVPSTPALATLAVESIGFIAALAVILTRADEPRTSPA